MELNRFCWQDFGSNWGDKQVPTTWAHWWPSDLAQSTTWKVTNVLDSEWNNEEE
jgi:hypothetical protein